MDRLQAKYPKPSKKPTAPDPTVRLKPNYCNGKEDDTCTNCFTVADKSVCQHKAT